MSVRPSVVFERSYGVRQIATPSGELITSVSQPDWPTLVQSLGGLARQGAGKLITTPELITSTDIDLADLSQHQPRVEDRIAEAKELTRDLPESTLLLGSVAFDPTVEKPRNAVLFLRDGEEVGRTYKKFPIGKYERTHLHDTAAPGDIVKPTSNVLNIICSDFAEPPQLDDEVDTLLISACWGTPSGYPGVAASPDHRHIEFINSLSDDLFTQYDQLETIVMTDRAPDQNSMYGPFNFVAQR